MNGQDLSSVPPPIPAPPLGSSQLSYLGSGSGSGFLDPQDAKTRRRSSPEASSSRKNSLADDWHGENGHGHGDEEGEGTVKKARKTSSGAGSNLTSCEACRKGKRRCEPSPLVAPDHPDAVKLPCARCRRFALECIRVKVSKRKGPAPVDLSAISDAAYGFVAPTTGQEQPLVGQDVKPPGPYSSMRSESQAALVSAARQNSDAYNMTTSPSFPILANSPAMLMQSIPENLDQVVAGHVIDNIINIFFDYVYPLTPCLHRPTFIASLAARLDKTDPVFFALTLTVLASTLVQVPRHLVNLEKVEIEALARRCVRVARAKMSILWENVQSSFILIAYLEGIVHLLLGNNTAHVIATATANQLALTMRLNEESASHFLWNMGVADLQSYEGLDPIESEMRRRIYWLLFQADKSTACLRARTINLRLDDAPTLRLPTEVDDEQITSAGVLPQPLGRTPLIVGFNVNTSLFRILNDALLLQRRKVPPTVDSILADLQSVNELRESVLRTTMEVATPLQMRKAYDSRASSPSQDWEAKLQTRFLDFFHGSGGTQHALNSFLVMQGNILVTQHVVRLVLLQTRDSLYQQLALITQMPVNGVGGVAGDQMSEAAETIATELLDGLHSIPIECVATNGPSLVQKVRFVAIQLMESSVTPSPSAARAQKLLMQFLSVLSVIEGMYTFGRDISAE